MTEIEQERTELLYRALSAPIGIAIATNNAMQCRTSLNILRKALNDDTLSRLDITLSPEHPEREVWLLKRPAARPEAKSLNDLGLD